MTSVSALPATYSRDLRLPREWPASTRPLLLTVGAAVVFVVWLLFRNSGEAASDNYRHLQQVNQRWSDYQRDPSTAAVGDGDIVTPALKWITPTGAAAFTNGPVLAESDFDPDTTRSIHGFLPYQTAEANQALRDAQLDLQTPEAVQGENPDDAGIIRPSLSDIQIRDLVTGAGRMVRIRIFDSCFEDGDIVEVSCSGHPFATVSLTGNGTELSIPVNAINKLSNSLDFRPVSEGTSPGITVGLETSQGIGFMRTLHVGDDPQTLKLNNPLLFFPEL